MTFNWLVCLQLKISNEKELNTVAPLMIHGTYSLNNKIINEKLWVEEIKVKIVHKTGVNSSARGRRGNCGTKQYSSLRCVFINFTWAQLDVGWKGKKLKWKETRDDRQKLCGERGSLLAHQVRTQLAQWGASSSPCCYNFLIIMACCANSQLHDK